jgi:dTMP kinase
LLLGGDKDRWGPRAEALLFAAARSDHVDKTIRPALARGAWVVCDRFVDSSVAYQGADGLGDDAIWSLHKVGSAGLLPERTFLLSLEMTTAAAREEERDAGQADRFGMRDVSYRTIVAENFRTLAMADTVRWRIVDASGAPEDVTARLVAALGDLL